MRKMKKRVGILLTLAMGAALLTGCATKVEGVNETKMIDKYAACCTLGDYKNLTYEKTEYTVTDDDVENEVQSLLSQYTSTEQVTEGKVEEGDSVNVDFTGYLNGEEFSGGSTDGAGYTLSSLGNSGMIDGFEEQIMGHSIGETFDINVTFPEDYASAELAGQDAVFTITINYKENTIVPELTDDFVSQHTDFDTVDAYKADAKERLTKEYAENSKSSNQAAVVQAIVDATTVNSYPEEELKRLVDRSVENAENTAESYGYDLNSYVMAMGYENVEAFRDYVKEYAQLHLGEKIALCAVAKAEKITVSKSEFKDFKDKIMEQTGYSSDEDLYAVYSKEDIVYYALAEKVADYLLTVATPATGTDAEE